MALAEKKIVVLSYERAVIKMLFEEKTISSKEVYNGSIIRVHVDTVQMPEGRTATRDIVEHPGGVGVVPITENKEIIMVRQYRKPIEKILLEIPAGKLDNNEEPMVCGVRELEEETGYKAKEIIDLGFLYPTPGFANETTYLYMARGLYKGTLNLDRDEFIDTEAIPAEKVIKMIKDNEINDAKTVIGVLKAYYMGYLN